MLYRFAANAGREFGAAEAETFGHAISRCEIAANAAKTPTPASQKGRVLVNLFGSPNGKPTGVVAKW